MSDQVVDVDSESHGPSELTLKTSAIESRNTLSAFARRKSGHDSAVSEQSQNHRKIIINRKHRRHPRLRSGRIHVIRELNKRYNQKKRKNKLKQIRYVQSTLSFDSDSDDDYDVDDASDINPENNNRPPENLKDSKSSRGRRTTIRQENSTMSLHRDIATSTSSEENSPATETQHQVPHPPIKAITGSRNMVFAEKISKVGTGTYKNQFINKDGSGRNLIQAMPLLSAMSIIHQQASDTAIEMSEKYKKEQKFEESRKIRLHTDKHIERIIFRTRAKLRSTNLPLTKYERVPDHIIVHIDGAVTVSNHLHYSTLERKKNIVDETAQLLSRLKRQRRRMQQQIGKEISIVNSLREHLQKVDPFAKKNCNIHPLLLSPASLIIHNAKRSTTITTNVQHDKQTATSTVARTGSKDQDVDKNMMSQSIYGVRHRQVSLSERSHQSHSNSSNAFRSAPQGTMSFLCQSILRQQNKSLNTASIIQLT